VAIGSAGCANGDEDGRMRLKKELPATHDPFLPSETMPERSAFAKSREGCVAAGLVPCD
jgi:hypothetical protein